MKKQKLVIEKTFFETYEEVINAVMNGEQVMVPALVDYDTYAEFYVCIEEPTLPYDKDKNRIYIAYNYAGDFYEYRPDDYFICKTHLETIE